jgi:hypothetical protein
MMIELISTVAAPFSCTKARKAKSAFHIPWLVGRLFVCRSPRNI